MNHFLSVDPCHHGYCLGLQEENVGEHHGLVVLIEGGAAHGAHQSALAAVGGGQRVGQGVQLWITNLIHE